MSILDDFLNGELQDLPNDTAAMPHNAQAHHKHRHKNGFSRYSLHQSRKISSYANAENCLPCHQKNAGDFLAGNTPGVMAFYAPEEKRNTKQHPCAQPANISANTRPDNAAVEDAETVQRLIEWREEASY